MQSGIKAIDSKVRTMVSDQKGAYYLWHRNIQQLCGAARLGPEAFAKRSSYYDLKIPATFCRITGHITLFLILCYQATCFRTASLPMRNLSVSQTFNPLSKLHHFSQHRFHHRNFRSGRRVIRKRSWGSTEFYGWLWLHAQLLHRSFDIDSDERGEEASASVPKWTM